ncbi:MAG: hypothetical protein HQL46_00985 [Gammaproteobacteria bacterium]|nr:hypothetical protein [Gammaproteobacteria bacterium]
MTIIPKINYWERFIQLVKPGTKTVLDNCIDKSRDSLGDIYVYEQELQRILTFGNQIEQSRLNIQSPHQLQHNYTQAMLLSVLLVDKLDSSLILGLGGGALLRTLHFLFPSMDIHAVEYRQAVLNVAWDYFMLPKSSNTHYYCDDAISYLYKDEQQYDLIFSDLYLSDSVSAVQNDDTFYQQCKEHLSAQGILVINQWETDSFAFHLSYERLKSVFNNQVCSLVVKGGNNILYAFNNEITALYRKPFFNEAHKLGLKIDNPMQKHARAYWQENVKRVRPQ